LALGVMVALLFLFFGALTLRGGGAASSGSRGTPTPERCCSSSLVRSRSGVGVPREPDDAACASPGALAALGPASERDHRARPAGRALCVFGGPPRATPARRVIRRGAGGAGPGAQRPAAQPLGFLPLQRAHGAASHPHARLPAAAALRDARVGDPAPHSAPRGAPVRALGHTSARRRCVLFGADHAVALPSIL